MNQEQKEKLRIAVAEEVGYERLLGDPWKMMGQLAWMPKGWSVDTFIRNGEPALYVDALPNYPDSLDACAEFEASLSQEEEQIEYATFLSWNVLNSEHEGWWDRDCVETFKISTATPTQRCIAFLKTRNKEFTNKQ